MLAAEHNARVGNASDLPPIDGLNVPPDHPIVRRIEVLTESALTIVRRGYDPKTGRVFKNIGVEDIRSLGNFFALSSADGLPLIAIIDSADDMNSNAANALLKLLEEPPPNSYLFLVSHSPNGLLPTVRSRCTKLNCVPLDFADLQNALEEAGLSKAAERSALAMLSGGSPGEALRLQISGGLVSYRRLIEIMATAPDISRSQALKMATECGVRSADDKYTSVIDAILRLVSRLAKSAAGGPLQEAVPGEQKCFTSLTSGRNAAQIWAELSAELAERERISKEGNLDPVSVVLDMLLAIDSSAKEATGVIAYG